MTGVDHYKLHGTILAPTSGPTPTNGGMAREWSVDSLEILLGLMTRARAKRFKEALNVLIRDAQVEEAHIFNSKEETKMVHIIKVNPKLDQEIRHF